VIVEADLSDARSAVWRAGSGPEELTTFLHGLRS